MSETGVLTTRDYKLNSLKLINSAGANIDLNAIFVEMHLYQDLYSSVMSGELLVNDAQDIFSNFILCGNDYLRVSVDKPTLNMPLERMFRIYKVTQRTPVKAAVQTYVLHFCSEEMILSNSMKVSKSYKGMKTVDIISDVLLNTLKVDQSRIAVMEDTSGSFDFVVPYSRPFEIIQWATARSYDMEPRFCYFFFENSNGFCFQSLQSLYKQKPYKTLKYDVKSSSTDPSENKDSADSFHIINDFDVINSVSNGSFASRLLGVDIFSQKYSNYLYNLETAEAKKNLLNPYKQINDMKNMAGETTMSAYDSYFTTYLQINDTASERENSIDKWMQPRALHLAAINSFRIKVVIPGDITLKAGTVVEYKFPKMTAADDSGKDFDPYRSCKYLVTAVNHKFNDDNFISILELSSDSFGSPIPQAADLTSLLKKK